MILDSPMFSGMRFFLAGFSPQEYLEVKSIVAGEGGAVVEEYGPECTHVIVHKLVLDDPICVAARRDGKTLVTSLWFDQSLEAGGLLDTANIMYRPVKELTGIPGANELLICLTGYQNPERGDIMTKVRLMGARFSKPLTAKQVTHLICYKFEGEKYELAKRVPFTKVVNHRWLDDCLKAWKILPEDPYSHKSGYELQMMEDEAQDSEEETSEITGRIQITNLQNEMADAHNHSATADKVSIPSTEQGYLNSSIINDEKLLKPDLQLESRSVNKLDKQPAWDHNAQSQKDAKSDKADKQNVAFIPSNQILKGLPSTSVNAKTSADFDVEKFGNSNDSRKTSKKTSLSLNVREDLRSTSGANSRILCDSGSGNHSPLTSKKSSRSMASLQPAGKLSKLDGGLKDKLSEEIIDDRPAFNLETDKEASVLGCAGVSSFKRLDDSGAGKHSPLNSRQSSVSLKSAVKLSNLDNKVKMILSEKVIADACTSTIGQGQGKAASAFGVSSTEAGLCDERCLGDLLPQKRTADSSNVYHASPKPQKLASSASKRVDAEDPKTPVTNPPKNTKIGSLSSRIQIGDVSSRRSAGRLSPDVTSTKSNAKNVASSRSLAFEMLQSNESTNTDARTSSNIFCSVAASTGVGINDGEQHHLLQTGAASPGSRDLKAVKSGSPKLNSGDQTSNSGSKPPRRKMVARKTLGSRPKVSKRKADAQRSSYQDDATIDPVGQENREKPAPSPAADKVQLPPTVDEPGDLGSKPLLKSGTVINDHTDDETKALPELEVCNEKSPTAEQLHLESRTGEASGAQLHQTEVSTSASDQICRQGKPVARTVRVNQNSKPQKKELAVKAKKKRQVPAEEAAKYADEAEGEKSCDSVKEQVVGPAAKKRRGTLLLNKSERPVEVDKESELVGNEHVEVRTENEPVSNDQCANKGVGKLALKKRRGTPRLNKSVELFEMESESEPINYGDEGQNDDKEFPGELAATSNVALGDVDVKNKNDSSVRNDQGTGKVDKCPGKLPRKKRRGTLLLKKPDTPDEEDTKIESVLNGGQHPGKLAGASGILDGSMKVEKENVATLGNNQGSKDGKRAGNLAGKKRRGTLLLNKSEAKADEEKENEQVLDDDEDKSNCGVLAEKLVNASNLNANERDAANSDSVNIHELKEVKKQPACFILSGHRLQRKEFQQLIKRLKGKVCRDSHQWSYQASHFIVPDPIRRTEKFFAAAASGSWILKTDYLTASSHANTLLPEEPYEWHKNGLSEDGAISLEAPRKWRLLKERTGHGAFYGMRIIIYGECIAPPLDTLKRVVKAGDGTIVATSPPYTRVLQSEVDFAIVSPGMPRVDVWVQEFLRHQIPCVLADYLVEYVCKPGYPLDRHVQYNTHEWAAKSFKKLSSLSEKVVADAATSDVATPDDQVSDDLACQVCGSTDRGEVMLVCGNENGSVGCGIGTHIDCCDPPLEDIPEQDWFCPKCAESINEHTRTPSKKIKSSNRR